MNYRHEKRQDKKDMIKNPRQINDIRTLTKEPSKNG